MGPGSSRYEELLAAIKAAAETIARLEALPPSPKREIALELLHAKHAQVVAGLNELPDRSHRN